MNGVRSLDVAQAAPSSAVIIDLKSRRRTALQGTADPHLAWERKALALRAKGNARDLSQPKFNALFDRWNRLEDQIAETPATTLAGIAVQLRLTRLGFSGEASDYARETAVETALATIERLAGRA